jgi:obg-like ATPase 1
VFLLCLEVINSVFSLNTIQEEMEMVALERINEALLAGKPARLVPLSEEESKLVQQLCLLTMKPVIFAANVAESDLADSSANPHVQKVVQRAAILETEAVVVSAQVASFPVHCFPHSTCCQQM